MQNSIVEKRITQIRLGVWITSGLLAFWFLRSAWPLAWQVAAFGALFTLLWPFVGGRKEEKKKRRKEEETEDNAERGIMSDELESHSSLIIHHSSLSSFSTLQIGLDLLVATVLVAVSGGFGSPFAPLVFGVVLEAFALLGRSAAVYTGLLAGLVNLAHFRVGVTPTSAILYGLALGTLGAAGMAVRLAQRREGLDSERPSGAALIRPPDVEELQAQLAAAYRAQEQMKDNYRAITNLHHDQKAQAARTRMVEQLAEISAGMAGEDTSGSAAFNRILALVMELTGASGGVLWLRGRDGSSLTVGAAQGPVAIALNRDPLPCLDALTPDAVRAHCETALLHALPAALPSVSRLDALFVAASEERAGNDRDESSSYAVVTQSATFAPIAGDPTEVSYTLNRMDTGNEPNTGNVNPLADNEFSLLLAPQAPAAGVHALRSPGTAANPGLAGVTLLRTRPTPAEPNGSIVGAIGVCDPRGRQRFLSSELEKVSSLCRALTSAVSIIRERTEMQRQCREFTQLRDLSRMAQTALNVEMDAEQAYTHIVNQVMELVPCENCTLFLLDARGRRLEAKATRGEVVNLLDHIRFERGHGVSGWVAASGKPLNIPDLTEEPNLRYVETIPPQIRSFAAIPVRVQDTVFGVLNVSHALPHAFTPADMRLLTELSAHAARLLEHTAVPQFVGV